VRAHGGGSERASNGEQHAPRVGVRFGADLTAAEVRYLMVKEWALTADDVLWRRSKLGLRFTKAQTEALDRFMTEASAARP